MIKLNKLILCALLGATLIANGMESAHTESVPVPSLMSRLATAVVTYIKHPATRFGSAIGLTIGLAFSGAAAYSLPVLATIGGLAAASIMLSPTEVPATVSHLTGVPAAPIVETHPAEEPVGIPDDETPEILVHRMHVAEAVIFIDNNDAQTPLHAEIIEEGTNNWFHVRFDPEYRIYSISQEPGINPDGVEFLEEQVPTGTTYSMHVNQFVDVGPVAMLRHYKQLCAPHNPNF